LMIENIVPIYIDLSTPKHPLAAQGKNLAHISPNLA
jgi:hypothetical protein